MKVVGKIILVVALVSISMMIAVVGNGYDMYKEALEQMPLEEQVAKIRQKEYYAVLKEIPQIYKNAVISVEDHRFYTHRGIDMIAIGRAFLNDVKKMDFVEGGSTITQQLAKNMYFTQEKKITRKIAEVFMAFEIEKNYSKEDILELYLNTSYFGDGYYTVKEACKRLFPKRIKPNDRQ